jgi:hypothetical protein
MSFFNDDFGLSAMVDIDLSNPSLLCDVLLSSPSATGRVEPLE